MSRNLPIRRRDFDVPGFLAYVARNGGEVATPTNPYEVVRYRAHWRFTTQAGVHVVYAKENGLLTFTGGSKGHYRAFLDGAPMQELPETPRSVVAPVPATGLSKGEATRRKLIARDGDGCWFCGTALGDDCTLEHLVPKSKGGKNSLANYALAHRKCNEAAADMPLVGKIALREQMRAAMASSGEPA